MITLFDNETILKGYTREREKAAREDGLADGERRKAIETAKKMLYKAMPIDLIAESCGLSVPEINAIKAQMAN